MRDKRQYNRLNKQSRQCCEVLFCIYSDWKKKLRKLSPFMLQIADKRPSDDKSTPVSSAGAIFSSRLESTPSFTGASLLSRLAFFRFSFSNEFHICLRNAFCHTKTKFSSQYREGDVGKRGREREFRRKSGASISSNLLRMWHFHIIKPYFLPLL